MHKKYFDLQLFIPKTFLSAQLMGLEFQLDTYIDDVRDDDIFQDLNSLS